MRWEGPGSGFENSSGAGAGGAGAGGAGRAPAVGNPVPGGLFAVARPRRRAAQVPAANPQRNFSTCSSEQCEWRHRLRQELKQTFGTVRQPRKCAALDPMAEWPLCAKLVRLLHPLYLC